MKKPRTKAPRAFRCHCGRTGGDWDEDSLPACLGCTACGKAVQFTDTVSEKSYWWKQEPHLYETSVVRGMPVVRCSRCGGRLDMIMATDMLLRELKRQEMEAEEQVMEVEG